MTIADLLDREVLDAEGRPLGTVHDVRVSADELRVSDLVVGLGGFAYRLGYPSGRVTGPWLLRRLAAALRRDLHLVPWTHVRDEEGVLRLDVTVAELEQLEEDR